MRVLKTILAVSMFAISTLASADYRLIVPQEPGGGTSVWANVIAKEWEKKLGEKIIVEHIPGARDIPGANKFHNELRYDNKTIMVLHGGNAESYLVEKVDYRYSDYAAIGIQNMTAVVGHRTDSDPFTKTKFASGSGMNPDAMAITMMICGPKKDLNEYLNCYKDKFVYANGFKPNERRLAYMRGELNATRETPVAYIKFSTTLKENTLWFSHGILNLKTGKVEADPNFPESPSFQSAYKKKWGVEPSGDLYDAYLLVRNYRDVLQKSLWVDKTNPNIEKLRTSLTAMLNDPVSMAALEKDSGKYPWVIGKDVNVAISMLDKLTTKKALKDLVVWNSKAFGTNAIYKEDIAKNAR